MLLFHSIKIFHYNFYILNATKNLQLFTNFTFFLKKTKTKIIFIDFRVTGTFQNIFCDFFFFGLLAAYFKN